MTDSQARRTGLPADDSYAELLLGSFPAFYLELTRRPAAWLGVCVALLLALIVPVRHWLFGYPFFPSALSIALEWGVLIPVCLAIAWIRHRRSEAGFTAWSTSLLISLAIVAMAWDLSYWRMHVAPVPHGFTALFYLALMFVAGLRMGWTLGIGAVFMVTLSMLIRVEGASFEVAAWQFYFDLMSLLFTIVAVRAQKIEAQRAWEAQRQLQWLAFRDPLTQLSNRRHLQELTTRMFAQARRERKLIGIAVVDVDRFKRLNDTRGHAAGDQALQLVATILKKMARRPMDVVARIGGDEFFIALFDATVEHMEDVRRQIEEAIDVAAIPHPEGRTGRLSLSVGVICRRVEAGEVFEDLFREADRELYLYKRRKSETATPRLLSSQN